MKLRNLLLGSICAATMALGGCEKGSSVRAEIAEIDDLPGTKSLVYAPLRANFTGDKSYPVDKYTEFVPAGGSGFLLRKETDKYIINLLAKDGICVSFKLHNKTKGTYLKLTDYSVELIDSTKRTAYETINLISNSNKIECGTFTSLEGVPYCSESSLKRGNEIFLWGLNEMRFREHLWHFINLPNSAYIDPLDGWE